MIDPDAAQPLLAGQLTASPFVSGAGAEQVQLAALRRQTAVAQVPGDVVAQTFHGPGAGRRLATVDVRSPQQFVVHPKVQLLEQTTLGADLAWPRAPGRAPTMGWDGEPGYAAPIREGEA